MLEALGGFSRLQRVSSFLGEEFGLVYDRRGLESLAVVGVQGDGDWSVRFFPGSVASALVPMRSVLETMVTDGSYENGWILAHSHTNGSLQLSEEDISVTCALAWLGRCLEAPLVDHWLFSYPGGMFSSVSISEPGVLDPEVKFGWVT